MYLLVESQPTSDDQRLGAPGSCSAMKHDVVVLFSRRLHLILLQKVSRRQLQRLLQGVHLYTCRRLINAHYPDKNSSKTRVVSVKHTWDVDSLRNMASFILIWSSHIKKLDALVC